MSERYRLLILREPMTPGLPVNNGVDRAIDNLVQLFADTEEVRPQYVTLRYLVLADRSRALLHLHSVYSLRNLLASLLGYSYIVSPHGGYRGLKVRRASFFKRAITRTIERMILSRALRVQVLSEEEEKDVQRIAPRARTWVQVYPLNGSLGTERRERTSFDVLFIGRLDIEHKGLDLLIQAWASSKVSKLGMLTIAGPGDRQPIRDLIRRQYLSPSQVNVLGAQTDSQRKQLLQQASYFVHTSRREGLPLSVLEALREGVPCLLTTPTNLTRRIEQYQAGFCAQPSSQSIEAMLDMTTTVSDKEYVEQSASALRLIDTEFSPSSIRAAFLKLIHDEIPHHL